LVSELSLFQFMPCPYIIIDVAQLQTLKQRTQSIEMALFNFTKDRWNISKTLPIKSINQRLALLPQFQLNKILLFDFASLRFFLFPVTCSAHFLQVPRICSNLILSALLLIYDSIACHSSFSTFLKCASLQFSVNADTVKFDSKLADFK